MRLRNRAILLFGFASGLRRSELVGLDADDLRWVRGGVQVRIRRGKTDQRQQGRWFRIRRARRRSLCGVRALRAWLDHAGITSGPVFRRVRKDGFVYDSRLTPGAVYVVIRQVARAAGITGWYSPHSLRAGLVTAAAGRGVSQAQIARVTGHRDPRMIQHYDRAREDTDDAGFRVL